jgi:NAD(P)H-quinone oxidoreductase subunit 5
MVSLAKFAWTPTGQPNAHPFTLLASFIVAVGLTIVGALCFEEHLRDEPGLLVLGSAFAMALAYSLWSLWSQTLNLKLAAFGAVFGGGIVVVFFALHQVFGELLGQNDWTNSQLGSWPGILVAATVLALFLGVLVVQTELPQWTSRPWFQKVYVHARNGFYFNTLANRFVAALWPLKNASNSNHERNT